MTNNELTEEAPRVRDIFKNGNVRKWREYYEKNRRDNFKQIKAQCDSIKESGYQGIDVEMIPYLEFINSIPDVATTWCCSGHYKEVENVEPLKPRLTSTNGFRRHVSFMLKEIGYHPLLEAIEDCLRATDGPFNHNVKITLRQVPLRWKFAKRGSKDEHYYTSYFLEIVPMAVPTVELYEVLCNAFLEALKERYFEIIEEKEIVK